MHTIDGILFGSSTISYKCEYKFIDNTIVPPCMHVHFDYSILQEHAYKIFNCYLECMHAIIISCIELASGHGLHRGKDFQGDIDLKL